MPEVTEATAIFIGSCADDSCPACMRALGEQHLPDCWLAKKEHDEQHACGVE